MQGGGTTITPPATTRSAPAWQPAEHREFTHGDQRYLFVVPQTSIVGIDDIAGAVLADLRRHGPAGTATVAARLSAPAETVEEVCRELALMGVLIPQSLARAARTTPAPPVAPPAATPPVQTVVLNVAYNCNLACGYCYADGGDYGGPKALMRPEVAAQAVDFLLDNAGDQPAVTVVFFGGEPLLNWPVIRETVLYAEAAAARAGKQVEFAVTTNGTRLTEEICRFFNEHKVGVTVSLDGPPAVHDAQRPLLGGNGSYAQAARGARLAVQTVRTKPVACRATVIHGFNDLEATFHHLLEIGFHEVGFAPVTTGAAEYQLNARDVRRMLAQFKALAEQFLEAAARNQFFGFSNLLNMLWDLHNGNHKVYPCGGGIGFFAVGPDGQLSLCHRFSGQAEHSYGDIYTGVDTARQAKLLHWGHVATKKPCHTCWIRHLCAGGCYHEAGVRHGDVRAPNTHYCTWLREWTEFCVPVYLTLAEDHPDLLTRLFQNRIPYPGV